jgi:hypothetical protein
VFDCFENVCTLHATACDSERWRMSCRFHKLYQQHPDQSRNLMRALTHLVQSAVNQVQERSWEIRQSSLRNQQESYQLEERPYRQCMIEKRFFRCNQWGLRTALERERLKKSESAERRWWVEKTNMNVGVRNDRIIFSVRDVSCGTCDCVIMINES